MAVSSSRYADDFADDSLTFKLPSRLKFDLRMTAARSSATMGEIARRAIEEYVVRETDELASRQLDLNG